MKPTKFDAAIHGPRTHVTADDQLFYFGEYTVGDGYRGDTNNLIANLKKSPARRGLPEWRYKDEAIRTCAELLRGGFKPAIFKDYTFVPVPPSKFRDDPEYDDRLVQVLRLAGAERMRELVVARESIRASHFSAGNRPTPQELTQHWELRRGHEESHRGLIIFDDVLTMGAHFRAMHGILTQAFPHVPVYGIFVALARWPEAADDRI